MKSRNLIFTILLIGLMMPIFASVSTTDLSSVLESNYVYADGVDFWLYGRSGGTTLERIDGTTLTNTDSYFSSEVYFMADIIGDVAVMVNRNIPSISLMNTTTFEVYANMSVNSIYYLTEMYHVRNDIYLGYSPFYAGQYLFDLNGTLLSETNYGADFMLYSNEYAYLFNDNFDPNYMTVHKLDLTGSTITDLGQNTVNLNGLESDYVFNYNYITLPQNFNDFVVFHSQTSNRENMRTMIYNLSSNSVIGDYNSTKISYLKTPSGSTIIYNDAQNVFYDIMTKDPEGQLVITEVNSLTGQIINVYEKSLINVINHNYVFDKSPTMFTIPVDTGDDSLSFIVQAFTIDSPETALIYNGVISPMMNTYNEYILVQYNGTDIMAKNIYSSSTRGEFYGSFLKHTASNGKTALIGYKYQEVSSAPSSYTTFTFSGGSIGTATEQAFGGHSPVQTISEASYGVITESTVLLSDSQPQIYGLSGVSITGDCITSQLEARPIVDKNITSFEAYYFNFDDEKFQCISNFKVYDETGNEVITDFDVYGKVYAVNYTGGASDKLVFVFKTCVGDDCHIGSWGEWSSTCRADPMILSPSSGNVNVTAQTTTLPATIVLYDYAEGCALKNYVMAIDVDGEFVSNMTELSTSFTISIPDDGEYLVEASVVSTPALYSVGATDSVTINVTHIIGYSGDYGAEDIPSIAIDVIGGMGAELNTGVIVVAGMLIIAFALFVLVRF